MRRLTIIALLLAVAACRGTKAEEERVREETVELTAGRAIDCAGALNEARRVICADVELRALDRRMAELWAELEPLTGRPSTFARRRDDFLANRDAGRRDPETGELRARTAEELRDLYEAHLPDLEEELRQARTIPASSPASALAGGCIGTALDGCSAPAAGYVTAPDGRRLAWQIQAGSTSHSGMSAGLILFSVQGEVLTPVGWSFEAAHFDPPAMVEHDGALFVAVEGYRAGTGRANADLLFRLDGDRWTEIEVESWKAALDAALPRGLGAWKGVDYGWTDFIAVTSLWRDEDPNCCPTGGRAVIDLEVEGRSLRMADLRIEAEQG